MRLGGEPLHLDTDQGVKYVLKIAARALVGEHALAQGAPVKLTAHR